ncbi:glycosyltransferase family 4 protein [Niabella sp. CC-SYL272]|uniref:glycosyltransferase n=1 Tax=Niabella agricola TaxID=2891571 RepID=UPI001F3A637C|nr:glycosyltransferase [Niabella agricola]MCF3109480.1 glycosyltransferase family 4 protein [Niabella agricola]
MKTVLYFFPLNLMKNNTGSIRRAWGMLEAFKNADCVVDYVYSFDLWGGPMDAAEADALKKTGLVREVYELRKKPAGSGALSYSIQYRINRFIKDTAFRRSIPDFVTAYNRHLFNTILEKNNYDYIVISYAYWSGLVKNNPRIKQAKLIVDTHDFLTAQELGKKRFSAGRGFADEMRRLGCFDQIWAISIEEQYLFRQFVDKDVKLMPYCLQEQVVPEGQEKEFDIIYVAGDNRHNVNAANWFFKEVYPLIDLSVRWCIVGRICEHIPDCANIRKVPYAPDLQPYYSRARLAICPMLSGTGVKIKVIEALAYGLPVVCNPQGVDGLVNKTENGCVVAESAKDFAESIWKLLNKETDYAEIKNLAATYFQKNHSEKTLLNIIKSVLVGQ